MFHFKAFVVTTLLSLGLAGCPSGIPDDSHNNDTETDTNDTDSAEMATLTLGFDVFGTTEDCELVVTGVDRAPIVCATGDPCPVPANVDLTIDIRGGVHETSQDPGYVVTRRQTVRLTPGESKTVTVKGNPAWFQENGDDWTIIDCRTYAVDDPNDSDRWYSFTTYNGGESVGVLNGYQLFMNLGHEAHIDFDGTDAIMVDDHPNTNIVSGTLELSSDGIGFEMTTSGNSNWHYDCFFDK